MKRAKSYQEIADFVPLKQLEAQVDAILNQDLYWFPIRHHSPKAGYLLQKAILQRRPKIVFIEGPADCNPLIPHLLDKASRPPLALYSSFRDDDNHLRYSGVTTPAPDIPARFASWMPLLDYSPEYVALKAAQQIQAKVAFIDLPPDALLKPYTENDPPAETCAGGEMQSQFYQAMAAQAGYSSWDEAWDSLFEWGAYPADVETFRRELTLFCAAVRYTIPQQQLEHDGSYAREAYMRYAIEQNLQAHQLKASEALVVCGGLHLLMDETRSGFPERPQGSVYNSLVPYSFFRVSALSQYAAGNRAPQFYQAYWQCLQADTPAELLPGYIVSVLKQVRKQGESASSADAIAIAQHAQMLARLRQRPQPILDDIHDAIMTCCCKGDPESAGRPLQQAMDTAAIGRAIGKVTPQAGQLPIVKDYHEWLQRLDLHEFQVEEKQQKVSLNTQEAADQSKSVFLHRLRYLKIPIGQLLPQNSLGTTLFKEVWQLIWSPEINARLIEENLYGDTVEAAVVARVQEAIAKAVRHAQVCCQIWYQALHMELPTLVLQLESKVAEAIAQDRQLTSLAHAIGYLQQMAKRAAFRQTHLAPIQDLTALAYNRACFAVPATIAVPEEQQDEVVDAIKKLAEAVFQDRTGTLDMNLLSVNLHSAALATPIPYLSGAFHGLLAELKAISGEEVIGLLSAYAHTRPEQMVQAGDFLAGMLSVSRSSLLTGSPLLITALESLLIQADQETFLMLLPKLRHAFEKMPRQGKNVLAEQVAKRHGLTSTDALLTLNWSLAAATLIATIDQQVANLMQEWDF